MGSSLVKYNWFYSETLQHCEGSMATYDGFDSENAKNDDLAVVTTNISYIIIFKCIIFANRTSNESRQRYEQKCDLNFRVLALK